jgi:CsoR family transcriptional regulator, copper-sensing transcriptional repressor
MTDVVASSPSRVEPDPIDRADRLQERLSKPVLVAALASVPAVFLTLLEGPAQTAGVVLNAISGAVLVAEVVVLFAVSDRRLQWLKRHLWLVGLALLMIPAVLFAVGPAQLLRLLRMFGALRIVRAGRILKAGRILRRRAGLTRGWQRLVGLGITTVLAVFVVVVLSDPTSYSRQVLEGAFEWLGITGVLFAGVVLAVATYVVRTARPRRGAPAGAFAAAVPPTVPEGGRADREAMADSPDR